MKKRLLALLMASAMVVTACGSGAPEAAATTAAPETTEAVTEAATEAGGTYTGKAAGFHGDITVEITVEGTKITDIQVVEQTETENIGGEALPTLVEQALKNQTTAVNAVSGATVTSDGFRTALEDAIKNAGLDVADYSAAVAEEAG